MTTTTTRPAARQATTARNCEWCSEGQCDRCGATGQTHRDSFYFGGHGYRVVDFCHDQTACERRRDAEARS